MADMKSSGAQVVAGLRFIGGSADGRRSLPPATADRWRSATKSSRGVSDPGFCPLLTEAAAANRGSLTPRLQVSFVRTVCHRGVPTAKHMGVTFLCRPSAARATAGQERTPGPHAVIRRMSCQ